MRALIDYANIIKFNYQILQSYLRTHGISFTDAGQKSGSVRIFLTRHGSSPFQLTPQLKDQEDKYFIYPSPENEALLVGYLEQSQADYRNFLGSCVAGHIDIDFVNQRLSQFGNPEFKFFESGNPFEPSFEINFYPNDIETHIDVFEIIYPIWRGEGSEFSRIKQCPNCGNFFYARNLKAQFCTPSCRSAKIYRESKAN